MAKRFGPEDAVDEGSNTEYSCTFQEAAIGQPALDTAAILTLVATLKNVATNGVINSRSVQNVLNANGGTVIDGTFTLELTALDNIIVSTTPLPGGLEQHRLTLAATYSKTGGGTGNLNHEVTFYVRNLVDRP